MSQWNQQVAVITGAGSGIGAGLAKHAARAGMQVCGADIDSDGLQRVADDLAAEGLQFQQRVLDVSDADAVEQYAAAVFQQHGQVNLLFNNAGVLVDGKIWERELRDWRWILDVNVMGVIHGIRSFVPRMLQQNAPGRVVNTSSIGGLLAGTGFLAPYQATKHAVAAITESLYGELAQEPGEITASLLCPGEISTGIWKSERLREPTQQNRLRSEAEQQFHEFFVNSAATAMSPIEFAALVFEGIEQDKFWLTPNPEFKPLLEMRCQSILDETNPMVVADMSMGD